MSKELVLFPSAETDIQRGFNYYEDASEGCGHEFLLHIESGFAFMQSFPEGSPQFHRQFRRLLIAKFPYGIFYVNEPSRIVVLAVLDLRQSPEAIIERLEQY